MISEKEKELLAIMKELGAKTEMVVGLMIMLSEDEEKKEENIEKLIQYILFKGRYAKPGDVLKKAMQICMRHDQYMPADMYVRYTIPSDSLPLVTDSVYRVLVSYDNDRDYLIDDGTEEGGVYSAECFDKLDVSEVRYCGWEEEDGSVEVTEGFCVGEIYGVVEAQGHNYLCDNGKKCGSYEVEPTKFVPARQKPVLPFLQTDGALLALRDAMEFGSFRQLENHLALRCEFISQDSGAECHGADEVIDHIWGVSVAQLREGTFMDCALATVTESAEGNRFGIGRRCMPLYMRSGLVSVAFVEEEQGVISGIYLSKEVYRFQLDEP